MARLEIEITALDRASGKVRGIAKSLEGLDTKTKTLSSAFKRFESTLVSVSAKIAKLGAALSATLGAATSTLGYAMVRTNAQFEKFQITLTTLYKDGNKAKQVLDSIMDFAAKTPFQIDQLTRAWVQMKAMGLEPNLQMLKDIGDAVAALGGTQEVFEGIVRALGQIQAKGKVSAEELMQLAERGVPVFEILQEKLGLTKEQLQNIGAEGIEASKAIQALLEGMRERFGGNMERMSRSWEGMISNLKDQWTRFMKAVGESGAFQALKERLKTILDTVDKAFDSGKAQKWANIVGKAIVVFVDGVSGALKIMVEVGKVIYAIGEAIVDISTQILDLHKTSSSFWIDFGKGLWAAFAVTVNKAAAVAVELGGVLMNALAPIGALFEYMWEKFKATAATAINWVAEKIVSFVDSVISKIPWLKGKIQTGFQPIVDVPEVLSYEEILSQQRENIRKSTEKAVKTLEEGAQLWGLWGKKNSQTAKILFRTKDNLKTTLSSALGNIISIAKETGKKVQKDLQEINSSYKKTDESFKQTKKAIEQSSQKVQSQAKSIWDRLRDFFRNFWENFKKSRLGSVLDRVWQGIKSAWGQGAKEGEAGLVARVKNTFSGILSGASMGGVAGAVGAFLADQLLQNEKIRNALQKIFDAIQKIITPVAEVVAPIIEVIGDILLELRPVFKLMAELLKPIASAIREILKLFTKLDDFFKSVMKPVFDALKSVLEGLWSAVKALLDFLKNPGKGVKKALEGIPVIGDIVDAASDVWDNTIGSILHQGGLVSPVVAHRGMFLGSLRSDEVPVIAQQGEFVVNRQATAQYLPILQAINKGEFTPQTNITVNIYAESFDREFVENELVPMLEELAQRGKLRWS